MRKCQDSSSDDVGEDDDDEDDDDEDDDDVRARRAVFQPGATANQEDCLSERPLFSLSLNILLGR